MTETHIPGEAVTVGGRYMRQRCEWCGKTLIDHDLSLVQVQIVPGEEPRPPAHFPVGALVRLDGNAAFVLNPDDLGQDAAGHTVSPGDCCTQLDPAVTR